jgi:hypothetical protein
MCKKCLRQIVASPVTPVNCAKQVTGAFSCSWLHGFAQCPLTLTDTRGTLLATSDHDRLLDQGLSGMYCPPQAHQQSHNHPFGKRHLTWPWTVSIILPKHLGVPLVFKHTLCLLPRPLPPWRDDRKFQISRGYSDVELFQSGKPSFFDCP